MAVKVSPTVITVDFRKSAYSPGYDVSDTHAVHSLSLKTDKTLLRHIYPGWGKSAFQIASYGRDVSIAAIRLAEVATSNMLCLGNLFWPDAMIARSSVPNETWNKNPKQAGQACFAAIGRAIGQPSKENMGARQEVVTSIFKDLPPMFSTNATEISCGFVRRGEAALDITPTRHVVPKNKLEPDWKKSAIGVFHGENFGAISEILEPLECILTLEAALPFEKRLGTPQVLEVIEKSVRGPALSRPTFLGSLCRLPHLCQAILKSIETNRLENTAAHLRATLVLTALLDPSIETRHHLYANLVREDDPAFHDHWIEGDVLRLARSLCSDNAVLWDIDASWGSYALDAASSWLDRALCSHPSYGFTYDSAVMGQA